MKTLLLLLSLAALCACGSSYGAEERSSSPGLAVDAPVDAAISDRVREAILADTVLRAESGGVRVATVQGVVTLSGAVTSDVVRQRFEVVARSVGSVVGVVNRLVVDPDAVPPAEPMESTVDRAISDRVRAAIAEDPSTAPHAVAVRVSTSDGVVRLRGRVPTGEARSRIVVVARAVGSVVDVIDEMSVGRG